MSEFKILTEEELNKLSYLDQVKYDNSLAKYYRDNFKEFLKTYNKEILKELGFKRQGTYRWIYDLGWCVFAFELIPTNYVDRIIFRPEISYLWCNQNISYITYTVDDTYELRKAYLIDFKPDLNYLKEKFYGDITMLIKEILEREKQIESITYARNKFDEAVQKEILGLDPFQHISRIFFAAIIDNNDEEFNRVVKIAKEVHEGRYIKEYLPLLEGKTKEEVKEIAINSIYETRENPKNKKILSIKDYEFKVY